MRTNMISCPRLLMLTPIRSKMITRAAMQLCQIGILATVMSLFLGSSVQAQMTCSLGDQGLQQHYNPYLDQQPSLHANQELTLIYTVLCPPPYGCGQYLLVSNPTVSNAMAMAIGLGQTKIVYQPNFMNSIAQLYGIGATFGILAHEFGHHIDFHTTPLWMNNSWSRELKADAWAGCALFRTGIGTSNIENALRAIAQFLSPSHPGWPQRLQAVRTGFINCGGQWLNIYNLSEPY